MKTEKNNIYVADESDDFGFTTMDEDDILSPTVSAEIDDLKKRLEAIRKIYLPMLEKLAKDQDKPIIRWPNRGPIIDRHIKKLITLTEPGFK